MVNTINHNSVMTEHSDPHLLPIPAPHQDSHQSPGQQLAGGGRGKAGQQSCMGGRQGGSFEHVSTAIADGKGRGWKLEIAMAFLAENLHLIIGCVNIGPLLSGCK